jgi:hypothetical protein
MVEDVMGPFLILSTTSMEHEEQTNKQTWIFFCRQDLETGASMQQKVTGYSEPAIRGAAAPAGRMGARN